VDDLLQKVGRLAIQSEVFIALREDIPRSTHPQFIVIPFSNRLTGLAARNGFLIPFLYQIGPSHHPPGVGHSPPIVETPHQHQRLLVTPHRFVELSRFPRHQTKIGIQNGFAGLIVDSAHDIQRF
jgi:hypothetical protein